MKRIIRACMILFLIATGNCYSSCDLTLTISGLAVKFDENCIFTIDEEQAFSNQFINYFVSTMSPPITKRIAKIWVVELASQGVSKLESEHILCMNLILQSLFNSQIEKGNLALTVESLIDSFIVEITKESSAYQALNYIKGTSDNLYAGDQLVTLYQKDDDNLDKLIVTLVNLIIPRLVKEIMINLPEIIEKQLTRLSEG